MMQVSIRKKKYDFDIQSLDGRWKTQAGTFAFPVEIGGVNCFIKKFTSKKESEVLFKKLSGKEVVNIPSIYDIKHSTENEWYVFQSYNPGDLLYNKLKDNEFRSKIDIPFVCNELYSAITQLNSEGFWHNDICFLNIQVENNGGYLLLDIDSSLPLKTPVTLDSLINKSLFGIFHNYLIKYHSISVLENKSFDGVQYNLLQLAALLIFMQYLKDNPKVKCNSALESNSDLFSDYIALRHSKVKDLFVKGTCDRLSKQDFDDLIKYLSFSQDKLPSQLPLPTIKKLVLNGGIDCLKSATIGTIAVGTQCTLFFEYENANKVVIKLGNHNAKHFETSKGKYEFILNKASSIEIFASNKGKNSEAHKIILEPILKAKNPIIKEFKLSLSDIDFGGNTKLSWHVSDATEVSISHVGLSLPLKGEKLFSNMKNDTEFVITAKNKLGNDVKSAKKSLYLQVALPPLSAPTINIFEVNGMKGENITLNEGELYDIKWNVSNATKVFLNNTVHKPIGLATFTAKRNETFVLKGVNVRGDETKSIKSNPINIIVRKKLKPEVLVPEIIDFGIGRIGVRNNGDFEFNKIPDKELKSIDSASELYLYFTVKNITSGIRAFIQLDENEELKCIDVKEGGSQILTFTSSDFTKKYLGNHTAIITIRYTDIWEKQVLKKINYTLVDKTPNPIIKQFTTEIDSRQIVKGTSGDRTRLFNNSLVTVHWDTANSDQTILVLGSDSYKVNHKGYKTFRFNNKAQGDIIRTLSLTASNSIGSVKQQMDFEVLKNQRRVFNVIQLIGWLVLILGLLLLVLHFSIIKKDWSIFLSFGMTISGFKLVTSDNHSNKK